MEYKYKTVIFDMDGTVLDTVDDLTDSVNAGLLKANLPLRTRDEVQSFLGNGMKVLIEKAVPKNITEEEKNLVWEGFRSYYKEHCNDKTHAYDGIVELMEKLKEDGIKMAIVSNKADSACQELSKLYFDNLVDLSIGESSQLARKPAPDMVWKAIDMLGADKETSIYIGDSEVDFETAKNSNIACISVLWGFRTKEFLESIGATNFAKKPADIVKLLKQ